MDKYFLADAYNTLWPEPKENYERQYGYNLTTHPTAVCARALSAYNRWGATGIEEAKQEFFKGVDWLVENQDENGAWPVLFDWKVPGYEAKAPWVSCITQGMGLSVLARAAYISKRYTGALQAAVHPFFVYAGEGGLLANGDRKGLETWYEGIPSKKPKKHHRLLNEVLFAIIGLREAEQALRPLSGWQRAYYGWYRGFRSVTKHLSDFDLKLPFFKWSKYDDGYYWYSGPKYHWVVIRQLEWLADQTGDAVCKKYAEKWKRWGEQYGKDCTALYVMIRVWRLYGILLRKLK